MALLEKRIYVAFLHSSVPVRFHAYLHNEIHMAEPLRLPPPAAHCAAPIAGQARASPQRRRNSHETFMKLATRRVTL
jgi:hypothetical protein